MLLLEWYKPIVGWEDYYEISNIGTVRRRMASCGSSPGKRLLWNWLPTGYAKVGLCKNSKRKEFLVHRLVAETFIGDAKGMDVCHGDGIKNHNRLSNLRIDTRKGNMQDQIKHGKTPRGEKCGSNKYSQQLILAIKIRMANGERIPDISKETGIPTALLYGIRSGRTWGWLNG